VHILYNIAKSALIFTFHPLKALNHIARMVLLLAQVIADPSIWGKIGNGIVGGTLGQAAITGHPLSVLGLIIGGALSVGGISMTAFLQAIDAERGRRGETFVHSMEEQILEIPENTLTGFVLGLIIGGVQNALHQRLVSQFEEGNADPAMAEDVAKKFTKDNYLEFYSDYRQVPPDMEAAQPGGLMIEYRDDSLYKLTDMHPEYEMDLRAPFRRLPLKEAGVRLTSDGSKAYGIFDGEAIGKETSAQYFDLNGLKGNIRELTRNSNGETYGSIGGGSEMVGRTLARTPFPVAIQLEEV
jgi:hypothetical protein